MKKGLFTPALVSKPTTAEPWPWVFATATSVKGLVPLGTRAGSRSRRGVKKPDTVPLNTDEVVVPVVLTTTTKFEFPGTVNEYDAFGTVVPKPTTPLSPR